MKTIIVGGGKVGYYLAKALIEKDYDISIVEVCREQGQNFANNLDVPVIRGDGTNEKTLIKAGIENCESVIAITGRDEVNLVCCQLAKNVFGVKKTIAKVNNPKNVENLKKLGVDIAVSSTDMIIKQLEREVDNSRIKELLNLNGGEAVLIEVVLPDDWLYSGKQICDLRLPEGCNIVSIVREKQFIIPRGKTPLFAGDTVLLVTLSDSENEVRKVLKVKK